MTLGEALLRMSVAMYALGHWGCLIVGVLIGLFVAWTRSRVSAWRERRRPDSDSWDEHVLDDWAPVFEQGVAKVGGDR